jgi:hypothetical protein
VARGNNLTLASNTGQLVKTVGGTRNCILVLNPNNGIIYVGINGRADPTTWDWIVPSQSRAILPGPWEVYGLFFVDQSGAGQSGNITIFETDEKLELPDYAAIGIARLALQTSMDVTEGTQPGNPGVGVLRIWADINGNLFLLEPNGTVKRIVDTAAVLGGDLSGTLLNPTIAASAVTATKIANATITDAKIAATGLGVEILRTSTPGSVGFTPTMNQGATTITLSTLVAAYKRVGAIVSLDLGVQVTSAGPAGGGVIEMQIPAGIAAQMNGVLVITQGIWLFTQAATGNMYWGPCMFFSSQVIRFISSTLAGSPFTNYFAAAPVVQLASGDRIHCYAHGYHS